MCVSRIKCVRTFAVDAISPEAAIARAFIAPRRIRARGECVTAAYTVCALVDICKLKTEKH